MMEDTEYIGSMKVLGFGNGNGFGKLPGGHSCVISLWFSHLAQ